MKLPHDLSNERCAMLVHGFFSVLVLAELARGSSLVTDDQVSDHDLNAAFDRHCARLVNDRRWIVAGVLAVIVVSRLV